MVTAHGSPLTQTFCFENPGSITKTTPSIVSDVSAIFVETTHLRPAIYARRRQQGAPKISSQIDSTTIFFQKHHEHKKRQCKNDDSIFQKKYPN